MRFQIIKVAERLQIHFLQNIFRHTGISGSSAHEFAEVIICLIVDPSKEFVLFLFHFPSHSTAQRRLSPACGSHCNTYPAISCLIMANPVFFETNLIFSASKRSSPPSVMNSTKPEKFSMAQSQAIPYFFIRHLGRGNQSHMIIIHADKHIRSCHIYKKTHAEPLL